MKQFETDVETERFREALSAFPAGVTIVTSVSEGGELVGATVSAFMSLSLKPPLVVVSVAAGTRTATAARSKKAFAVHIVGARHHELAKRFASSETNKFANTNHRLSRHGVPILEDFDVILECSLHTHYPGGDHVILIGQVEVIRNSPDRGAPTVWFGRGFRDLALPTSSVVVSRRAPSAA